MFFSCEHKTQKLQQFTLAFFTILTIMLQLTTLNAATKISACLEDQANMPWQDNTGKAGMDIFLLNKVAKNLSIEISFEAVPWKRCLAELQSGKFDALFSASFKEERREFGQFPETAGTPDETKKLHTSSYSIYALSGKNFKVENGKLIGAKTVGTTIGYSIAQDLAKEGFTIDEAPTTELGFKKLVGNRIDVVATMTEQGDVIMNSPEFKDKVVKLEPPLVKKPYYLMLSKQFVTQNGELAKKIWEEISKIRETEEYKNALINTK